MRKKSCPHCHKAITLVDLKRQNNQKRYLNREPIPCPHCQDFIRLPALAEKMQSIGLLFSVIIAPLTYYWLQSSTTANGFLISNILFAFGIILITLGIVNNQPEALVSAESQKHQP